MKVGVRAWPFLPVDIWKSHGIGCIAAGAMTYCQPARMKQRERKCSWTLRTKPATITSLPDATQPARFAEAGAFVSSSANRKGSPMAIDGNTLHIQGSLPVAATSTAGALRFVQRGEKRILQQEWTITTIYSDSSRQNEREWRDVPLVEEPAA